MKKIISGFIAGVIVTTGVSVMANGLIERAEFNNVGVSFNGEKLELSQKLLSVQAHGSDNVSNYMPVREVLEGMGYIVNWNGGNNMIEISSQVQSLIESNQSKDKFINNEWVDTMDIVSVYGYTILGGGIHDVFAVYESRESQEPIFISALDDHDNERVNSFNFSDRVIKNEVRIIREEGNLKVNRQDLLDLGIELTPKE